MPWIERAKRLLGKSGSQKRDDLPKHAGKTSGGDKSKESQVKKDGNPTLDTSLETGQSYQQAVQDDIRDVADSRKDKTPKFQDLATPCLIPSHGNVPDTSAASKNATEPPRGFQKATPLGPTRERLWDEAYDILCEKEPKLMKAYERDLLSFQTQDKKGTDSAEDMESTTSTHNLIKTGTDRYEQTSPRKRDWDQKHRYNLFSSQGLRTSRMHL